MTLGKRLFFLSFLIVMIMIYIPCRAQDVGSYYQSGAVSFGSGDYHEAAKNFNIVLLYEPYHRNAISMLQKISEAQTQDYMSAADDAFLLGHYRESIDHRLMVVAANPYESDYRRDLTDIYTKAIEKDPEESSQLRTEASAWKSLNEGLNLFVKDDLSGAEKQIRKAVSEDYSFAIAHLYLAVVLKENGDSPGAEAEFTEALNSDPDIGIPADSGPHIWKSFCAVKGEPFASAPAESRTVVMISSSPNEADIYVNNILQDQETNTVLELSPGEHLLELRKPGHRSATRELRLRRGINRAVDETLPKVTGSLFIKSDPANALIYIDGELRPEVTQANRSVEISLALGKHVVTLRPNDSGFRDRFEPYVEEVTIVNHQKTSVYAKLIRRTQLYITSDPPHINADLGFLGKHKTPVELSEIEPGTHVIRGSRKGYKTASQTFTIEPYEYNELYIQLFPKSRMRMALYSLAIPGAGQYYGGRYISGTLFLTAGLGTAVAAIMGYLSYEEAKDYYDDSIDQYRNAFYPDDIRSARINMRRAYDDADKKSYLQQATFVGVGIVWAANIVHVWRAGPGMVEAKAARDILQERGWDIVPRAMSGTVELTFRHRF